MYITLLIPERKHKLKCSYDHYTIRETFRKGKSTFDLHGLKTRACSGLILYFDKHSVLPAMSSGRECPAEWVKKVTLLVTDSNPSPESKTLFLSKRRKSLTVQN